MTTKKDKREHSPQFITLFINCDGCISRQEYFRQSSKKFETTGWLVCGQVWLFSSSVPFAWGEPIPMLLHWCIIFHCLRFRIFIFNLSFPSLSPKAITTLTTQLQNYKNCIPAKTFTLKIWRLKPEKTTT